MASPFARPSPSPPPRLVAMPRRNHSHKWWWIFGILLILLAVAAVCVRIVISRAEPMLRTRVIESLSARFKSRVELAELHVWIANGVHVTGKGLQVYGLTDPNPWQPGVQPLFAINEFRFQTDLRNLFREPMKVDTIYVTGLNLNIPPSSDRQAMTNIGKRSGKISIAVDHFVCTDTKLIINTARTDKPPLEFDIGDLRMKDIGPGLPLQFDATLINPKPTGDIHSTGQFGPLNERSPRDSSVQGTYSFSNADLGTLKGIAGILSSTGKYGGTLGRIVVDGETDTPDFRLAVSGHPVPLHTDFHAIVDGTDGDTYLEPVDARVLHSAFTARGKIVRMKSPQGHDIELEVSMNRAQIEDLLQLGVRTDPPVMNGSVSMRTKLSLPPGQEDIADRLRLAGTFHIPEGRFANEKVQDRIDSLSMRSQGKPKLANPELDAKVPSDLQGTFRLSHGLFSFSFLHFQIPGTHADMAGQYSLDGNLFDFHGILKMDAKLSQMTTGWKSILLKPVDPFFHKDGAGTELPFKVTGTREAPKFGLDFHHDNRALEDPHSQKTNASR